MANKNVKEKGTAVKVIGSLLSNRESAPSKINVATTQGSVPIESVHEKYGLIESYGGCFNRSYLLGDNNYLTSPDEEQETYYKGWRRLLNSFGSNTEFALTIYNRSINRQEFCDETLLKESGDKFNYLRKQMNTIILDRMTEGKNGIQKDKYLTVAVHTKNAKKASEVFHRLDRDIDKSLQKISSSATPISIEERMEILYGIYNDSTEHLIQKSRVLDNDNRVHEVKSFDFDNMRKLGLTVNDLIAPSSMQIYRDHMQLGNKLVRVLKVTQFASMLSDEFLTNVTDMSFNCVTTINYKPIAPKKAEVIVAKNLSFIRDEKQRAIRAGQKVGIYDDSYVDPNILDREAEALALRDAMHERDEKLFETSITVIIFADDMERLDEYTDTIITEYKKASMTISVMTNQQEDGFNSTLPLCFSRIIEKRTLTSSSAAIFIPFSTLELNDAGGINYSCNLLSHNLIVYDRMSAPNFNGFILGTPGAGKSFAAKTEMLFEFLRSNSDIIVIDPEDEYGALAKMLDGETIKIVPGGDVHINPMEIVSDYEMDDEENPINAKADFVLKMMECMVKSPFGIDSVQETIIDECVHELFSPFVVNGQLREIPADKMPTLTDLQRVLGKRREPEARELSMSLKLYSGDGSLNAFGFQTNVHTNNRFVVYQIRDIGDRLKSLAMLSILDHIWNRIVQNRKIGRTTFFYVDEIYLLFQNEYSATFLNTLFRRARKYGGVPTGITQNVTPLLESPTARDMLQNCCFIEILAQAGPDRELLRDLLNLSSAQVDVITSSPKGQGLLYTGKNVVPFYSQFPKDNDVYRCLTSDLKEIKAFEAQEKRKEAKRQKEARNIA